MPLVLDSPHSGDGWPADFGTIAPRDAMLSTRDAWVDELWSGVVDVGGILLSATFPSAYVNANRDRDDLDESLLDEPWPEPVRPSAKSAAGMGLIRRLALPGIPMYDRNLTIAEVRRRLETCFDPYVTALDGLLDEVHTEFGQVWHLDCHSMKSRGNAMNDDAGRLRPDMVVSDREGTTAHTSVTALVARELAALGYDVSINDPYRGGALVQRTGRPHEGRQAVQIEINRRLYMDEGRFARSAGFDVLAANLNRFLHRIARHLSDSISRGQIP